MTNFDTNNLLVEISNATKSDIDAIIKIADQELGKNYITPNAQEWINSAENIFIVAKNKQQKIIGFCYAYYDCTNKVLQDLSINQNNKNTSKQLGVLKTIAVQANYKKKGIGTALVSKTIEMFISQHIKSIYIIAWKNNNTINIGSVLKNLNFEPYCEIQNYWTAESIKKQYECPQCGIPCQCSAVVFVYNA